MIRQQIKRLLLKISIFKLLVLCSVSKSDLMQAEHFNPVLIQTIDDQNSRNRDLFQILLDQHYAPAMPIESYPIQQQSSAESDQRRDHQGCKCTKIDCLKLYCECFARGRICNENCICVCCRNKSQNSEEIFQAKKIANYRNPGFFKNVPAFIPLRKCTCKKSQCRKKYCECFSAGLKCTQQCECFGCENGKCHHHKDEQKMYPIGIQVHA